MDAGRIVTRYLYPYIECPDHQGPQFSYVVCKHVAAGTEPERIIRATEQQMGIVVCEGCADAKKTIPEDDLFAACALCVEQRGWL